RGVLRSSLFPYTTLFRSSRIRAAESEASQAILGIARYETLDNHDGQLMPSLALRQDIVRLIRNYGADLVLTHRPYDYHPDHRYRSEEHTSELQSRENLVC